MEKTRIPLSARRKPITPNVPHPVVVPSTNLPNNVAQRPARRGLVRRSISCSDLRTLATTPLSRLNAQSTRNVNELDRKPMCVRSNLNPIQEKVVPSVKVGTKRVAPPTVAPTNAKVSRPAKIPPYDYKARFNSLLEKHKILQQTSSERETALIVATEQLSALQKDSEHLKEIQNIYNQSKQSFMENEAKVKELDSKLSSVQQNFNSVNSSYLSLVSVHDAIIREKEKLIREKNMLVQELSEMQQTNRTQQELLLFHKTMIQEHEDARRIMHNQIQDLKGTIRVFCRIRPPLSTEQDKMLCNIIYVDDDVLEIRKTKELTNNCSGRTTDGTLEFVFDKVFQPEASQMDVFKELSQLIQSAMDGYHVCVFAYGQTGSGKTYTMQGGDYSSPGMIPQTVDLIFKLIAKYQQIGWIYTVEASFLEIYNESIRDLLNTHNKEHLEIRFNEGKGTTVTNLTIKPVHSPQELHSLVSYANQNRAVAVTNYNEHSSRSHVVTKITLTGIHGNTVYIGSLSLVDLAGSESAKSSTSERLTETKNINKSLSALGSVMTALQNKDNHIPYRNSKLTYLLQSSLGGNSKTLMFVNIAPFHECYNETINALRFASKVKEVKLMMKKNKSLLRN
ncbi:hypothetical protein RI129_007530 [Pyrocoelia pectoralis]|uniref:Kinesin-like protein n=1 Tax=Pyrocoelia pectoralis TaxID=417401 RepID=A0AAN7ZEY3_9COLE